MIHTGKFRLKIYIRLFEELIRDRPEAKRTKIFSKGKNYHFSLIKT